MKQGCVLIVVGSDTDEKDSGSVFPLARQIIADMNQYISGKGDGGTFDGYEADWVPIEDGTLNPSDQPALIRWAIRQLEFALQHALERAEQSRVTHAFP